MKFNLATVMQDHRGEPMKDGEDDLTLGLMLERACVAAGKPSDDADTKFKQFKLAQRIAKHEGKVIELSPEDVVKLKALATQVYTPIAYGALAEALDNPMAVDSPVGCPDPATTELLGDMPIG